MSAQRQLLSDHAAGSLKMTDEPVGDDPRHILVRVVPAVLSVEFEGEGQSILQFGRSTSRSLSSSNGEPSLDIPGG